MAISVVIVAVLLMMLGAAFGVLSLIMTAIQQRKYSLLALFGGLAGLALFMIICALAFMAYPRTASMSARVADDAFASQQELVSAQSRNEAWVRQEMENASRAAAHTAQQFQVSVGSQIPSWFAYSKLLLLAGLACALAFFVYRRMTMPPAAGGQRRRWPAFLAIPLVVLLLGFVRVEQESNINSHSKGVPMATQTMPPASPAQSAALANGFAKMEAEMHQQIEHGNIQALIDKSDQPRIPLPPDAKPPLADVPKAVAPPMPARAVSVTKQTVATENSSSETFDDKKANTASDSEKPRSKSTVDNSTKTASASKSNKEKKAKKPSPNAETKASKEVAQATAAASATDSKSSASQPSNSRPAWVDQPPRRTRNNGQEVIVTDEYQTDDECYQAADIYLMLKTYQRIQQLAGRPYGETKLPSLSFQQNGIITADGQVIAYGASFPAYQGWADPRLRALGDMGIGPDFIHREIVSKDTNGNEPREYLETVDRTFGPMHKLYMQIEFSPSVDRDLRAVWNNYERKQRFFMFGAGAGSVLSFIGLIFGLLKLDTWTKGYYTKRLFIGLPAAIIMMVIGLVMLAGK
jgi:hypothetical protein